MQISIRNGKELNENQYISYLEGMAQGLFMLESWANEKTLCSHSKLYDPLYIEKEEKGFMVHSYVFDLHNGGRHHKFKTLENIELCLIKELKRIIKEKESE